MPSSTTLLQLARELRVDVGWLTTGNGSEPTIAEKAPVIGTILALPQDIESVVDLMRAMNAAQRGEVLGYARRVAETRPADGKANAAS